METGVFQGRNGAYSAGELADEAVRLAHSLARADGARVVALTGDLGAGKTTFAQAFAKALGVTEPITSPTYVIEKIYPLEGQAFERLVHIDAYRLESEDELRKLDWARTAADPGNIILIEWADRVPSLIPERAVRIALAYRDEETRTLTYGQ